MSTRKSKLQICGKICTLAEYKDLLGRKYKSRKISPERNWTELAKKVLPINISFPSSIVLLGRA